MSDDTASNSDNSSASNPEPAPRARRVSTPRPKKVAKSSAAEPAAPEAPSVPAPVAEIPAVQNESFDGGDDASSHHTEGEWPEPEAASTGTSSPSEGAKRKRRRRKGKGGQASAMQNGGHHPQEAVVAPITEPNGGPENATALPPRPQVPHVPQHKTPPPPPAPRVKIDPELLTKMAWKIYLAEVSEEGVALIGDNDAKDLSRRCFRLAEIFIEEQSRRR